MRQVTCLDPHTAALGTGLGSHQGPRREPQPRLIEEGVTAIREIAAQDHKLETGRRSQQDPAASSPTFKGDHFVLVLIERYDLYVCS